MNDSLYESINLLIHTESFHCNIVKTILHLHSSQSKSISCNSFIDFLHSKETCINSFETFSKKSESGLSTILNVIFLDD